MCNRSAWIRANCKIGETILDIGSNSGFTFKGTELEQSVTSIDLDVYNVPNFYQMDAHNLTFADKTFDVAVLGDVLEHVKDPVQVLKEAKRVAKRIVITVPDEANWSSEHHPYSTPEDIAKYENLNTKEELAKKANPDAVKVSDKDNYQHCFHNRFYSEESLKKDLKEAEINNYNFDRLQYDGWCFFTIVTSNKLPSDVSPEEVESQFDRSYFVFDGKGEAKGYRGTYTDFPENLKFLEYIKSLKPESVLEAGCSYGFLVKRLNDAGISAEGFDVSSFAIKMRATDKIKQASILDLSYYKDKQFDLVVSIEILEHVPEAYTEQALKELARVSKRGVHWIAYKEVDDLFQTKDITHVCFPQNTRVSLSDGTVKPISAVEVGDIILGEFKGTVVPTVVKQVFSRLYSGNLYHILLDNQLELVATSDHPIKTEDGWTPINKLNIGTKVYATYAKMGEVDGTRFGVPQNELPLFILQGDWYQNRQNARFGTSQSQKFKTATRKRQMPMERRGSTNSKRELRKINTQGTFSSSPQKKMDNDIGQGKQGGTSKIGKAGVSKAPRANLSPRNYKSVHSGTYRWRGSRWVHSEQPPLVQSDPANIQFRQENDRLHNSITSAITKRQEDATTVYTEYTEGKGLHKTPLRIEMAGLQTNPHIGSSSTLFNNKETGFGDCLDLLPYAFKETKERPLGGRREEYILGMAKLVFKTWANTEGETVYNLETETNNYFANGILVHNCIKPHQWWVDKIREICGSTHTVIHKETDWYPKPTVIPKDGQKKGLNVGSFVNCILNTEDTIWLNIDILDLEAYAKAYGYNFQKMDARHMSFPDNSFDYIVCSHCLEHLTSEEGKTFLLDCHRILKPNGIIRFAVPDTELLAKKYIAKELGCFDEINPECEKAKTQLDKLNALLWGGHKTTYDHESLTQLLEETGFKASIQSFNKSQRPDLMKQIFDYHVDLSIYAEGTPIKKKESLPLYRQYLEGLIEEGKQP